jgi:hypothetical protein
MKIIPIVKESLIKVFIFFILVILLHFISSNLYAHFCVHLSFFGFLRSTLLTKTPHCITLRYIQHYSAETIDQIWHYFGGSVFNILNSMKTLA